MGSCSCILSSIILTWNFQKASWTYLEGWISGGVMRIGREGWHEEVPWRKNGKVLTPYILAPLSFYSFHVALVLSLVPFHFHISLKQKTVELICVLVINGNICKYNDLSQPLWHLTHPLFQGTHIAWKVHLHTPIFVIFYKMSEQYNIVPIVYSFSMKDHIK